MAELTVEQFEQVPEFLKGDFELSGEVYVAKSELKAKALKQSLNDLDGKYKSAESRIAEIEAKAEENRTKAEQAALEKLKKEGKVDEILADFEKRTSESNAQYEARIEKLVGAIKADKRNLVLNDLASELKVFDDSKKLFSKLVQDRIDVDPESGKITYLDENGGATSLDKAGFLAELSKDSGFDRMRQAQPNTGGMANGNNSGGGASTPSGNFGGSKDERKAAIAKKFNLKA